MSSVWIERWCLVAQLCPATCDPMDCRPPGSSVHGDSPDKNTGVGCHALIQSRMSISYEFTVVISIPLPYCSQLSPLVQKLKDVFSRLSCPEDSGSCPANEKLLLKF